MAAIDNDTVFGSRCCSTVGPCVHEREGLAIVSATFGRYRVFPALGTPGLWFVCSQQTGHHVGERYFPTANAAIEYMARRELSEPVDERYPDRVVRTEWA